ncbi:hypothetical protein EJB05_45126, partial [Eragrostis curvula]
MARYPVAPPHRVLDTCYNFTGCPGFEVKRARYASIGGRNKGRSGSDGLPLVHRSNPCSPLADGENQKTPSAEDILRRDAARLSSLLGDDPGSQSTASAPTPTSPSRVFLPSRGDPIGSLPGAFEYHVVAGFGTPVQNFTVGFDTATHGATLLQCKPCSIIPGSCDGSFDPSKSSSLAHVPCGSPDCPFRGSCSGPSCSMRFSFNGTFVGYATVVTDTLTLSPSATFQDLRFACLEAGLRTTDNSSGILDLSRNSHSLASRVPPSLFTVAFTYCLPLSPSTAAGFLKIAPPRPEFSRHNVTYTPIRSNAANGNLYIVGLGGLGLGGPDLGVPPSAFVGDSLLDLHTTFTYLKPDVYAALRNSFRKWMSGYRVAPPRAGLETCYDFTELKIIITPVITLKFGGGASLDLHITQMMYFEDPDNVFSVGCLAFVPMPPNRGLVSVIGTLAQKSVEVVYDVHAGKVGFIPYQC